jgi:hypothetical protein
LLRRESNALELGSGGEFSQVERQRVKDAPAESLKPRSKQKSRGDLCDTGFVAGKLDTNNCSHRTQRFIEDQNECGDLADELGVPKGSPFRKNCEVKGSCDPFPYRCYKSADDNKFYYNPCGDWPEEPKGTPYCETVLYINGTENSNDCDDDDYTNIVDEFECRSLETCTPYLFPAEFLIKNEDAAEQQNHPKGCHISVSGKVEFNNITGVPSDPKGKPLCKLKPADQLSAPE